jgi:hypothetical protein
MKIQIPDLSLQEWIDQLRPDERESIKHLLRWNNPDDVARIWIAAHVAPDSSPLDETKKSWRFWDGFRDEFNRFLWDATAYLEAKRQLRQSEQLSGRDLISVISEAIAGNIGVSPSAVAPAVALRLFFTRKKRKAAYPSGLRVDTIRR